MFTFLIVTGSTDEVGDDDNHNQSGQDATDDDGNRVVHWLHRLVSAVGSVEFLVAALPASFLFAFL